MVYFWKLPSARLCFGAQILMVATVFLGAPFVSFRIYDPLLKDVVLCIAGGLYFVALCAIPGYKFKDDSSRTASLLKAFSGRAMDAAAILIFAVLYVGTAALLSYMAMSAGMPMQDGLFAAIDQSLGLDWKGFVGFVNARPSLCSVLVWSYQNWNYQILFVIGLFLLQARQSELWDFAALLVLGAISAVVFCGLMPAVAAYTHHAPDAQLYDLIAQKQHAVGTVFLSDLLAVHSGTFKVFDWTKVNGIVTFPSFHAILAMAVVYAVRNDKLLFLPALVFNSLVVVSVVPVGGHYFVDVIGAGLSVLASVALIDWCNGRVSMFERARRALAQVAAGPLGRPAAL